MKKFAKVFMLIACVAMVFCFAAGVSADETPATQTVTIYLQDVVRATDSDNDGVLDNRLASPIITSIGTNGYVTAQIPVANLSSATLYDAVVASGIAPAYNTLVPGQTTDTPYWQLVNITEWSDEEQAYVPSGDTAYALNAVTVNGTNYINAGGYPNSNTWQGISWMWYYGTEMPEAGSWGATANYPTEYLSQVKVADLESDNYTFTLSFEHDFMTW